MMKTVFFITWLLGATFAQAQGQCSNLFKENKEDQTLVIKPSRSSISDMTERTLQSFLTLRTTDVLPAEFLNKIEKTFGRVTLRTNLLDRKLMSHLKGNGVPGTYDRGIHISLSTKMDSFMNFTLLFSKDSRYVSLDNLQVSDPLNKRDNLHFTQQGKGLPIEVFNYARDTIFKVLKSDNWAGLRAGGTNHYLVSMLYQRSAKMRPSSYSQRHYEYLSQIRKQFASSDIFYEALGSIKPDLPKARVAELWTNTAAPNREKKGFTTILQDNKPIAVVYKGSISEGKEWTFILDPFNGKKSFLTWSEMVSQGRTELVLDF